MEVLDLKTVQGLEELFRTGACAAATMAEWVLIAVLIDSDMSREVKAERIKMCYDRVDGQSKRYKENVRAKIHEAIKSECQTILMI